MVIEKELKEYIDEVWDVCSSRAQYVIKTIVKKGYIDSEDIRNAGYVHGARAIGDVRDQGIPLVTGKTKSSDGKSIASYTFGDSSQIRRHKYGGRVNFPAKLKSELVARDGLKCKISGDELPITELTIDHRIPYYISGDINGVKNSDDFMLLSKSMQRAKSWDCEQCENLKIHFDMNTCKTCYWASPESYSHVAMRPARNLHITWNNEEVESYDKMVSYCDENGITVQDYLKEIVSNTFD